MKMPKATVVYALVATVVLLFVVLSHTPHASRSRLSGRRLAHLHHVAFDPLVDGLERRIEERGLLDIKTFQEKVDAFWVHQDWSKFPVEIDALEEYFGQEGRLNTTERLMYLFPLLDIWPKDGGISFKELEFWNQRQAMDRLIYNTERQMKIHDKDGDGEITLQEYLPRLSEEEAEMNNMEHGQAGWWKEQFVNADERGSGSLNQTEFNNFLHPEDSSNPKIQMWLQKEKMREMDQDIDGKLSFAEFRDRAYDIYKNYIAFEMDEDNDRHQHVPNVEEKFAELDMNKDKFLTVEELKPIIHHLYPGELSYATYFTKYLMHEADDDRDEKLTLKEMSDHHYAFYSTVVKEGRYDEDDNDFHDEF